MRPNQSIREARLSDADCLAALAVQTWLQTYAVEGIRPTIARHVLEELTVDALRRLLARENAFTLIAEVNQHLVGFAVVETEAPCPALASCHTRLDKLYVQEHFLGLGFGFELLNRARIEASQRSTPIDLWLTVQSKNERARSFYDRQGFADIGATSFDLYGEKHENRILHAPAAGPIKCKTQTDIAVIIDKVVGGKHGQRAAQLKR